MVGAMTVSRSTAGAAGLKPVSGAQVWCGPDMARRADWIFELTAAGIGDLDTALRAVAGRDILDIRREHFPLPRLAGLLQDIRRELLHGRGFFLIRGLPVERWSLREAAAVFWGLGLHLGEAVSQNGKGHVLGHVKDLGLDYADPLARGYQTRARLPYHCDYSDLVGLLSLKTAREGGLSSIVSAAALYNEMLARRPDLAAVLTQPVIRDRWGEIPEGAKPWAEMPVFNPVGGTIVTTYVRSAVRKAQRFPDVPRLTAQQIEAMDLLDALAENPDFHLDMEFRPGDVQLLNNHFILHSRTDYIDWPEPERRRHLLRLWLACDDGPALPAAFAGLQGRTQGGRPDGIRVPGVPFAAPLDAE